MINHARTLLLNDPASRPERGVFGEEYVPPDAPRLPLPGEIAVVHRTLFGTNPEPLYQNSVLRVCANALHSVFQTDRYVRSLDPRLTYRLSGQPLVAEPVHSTLSSGPGSPALAGAVQADVSGGAAAFLYEIEASGDPAEIRVSERRSGFFRTGVYPGKIRLSCGADLVFPANPSGVWSLAVKAPLRFGPVEMLARLDAGRAAVSLMRAAPAEFRDLWATPGPVERLAGLLAGLVHRLEAIRNG